MKPICTAAPPIQQKHQEYMCSRSAIETTFYDVGIFWNPLMVSSKAFGGWKKHFDLTIQANIHGSDLPILGGSSCLPCAFQTHVLNAKACCGFEGEPWSPLIVKVTGCLRHRAAERAPFPNLWKRVYLIADIWEGVGRCGATQAAVNKTPCAGKLGPLTFLWLWQLAASASNWKEWHACACFAYLGAPNVWKFLPA